MTKLDLVLELSIQPPLMVRVTWPIDHLGGGPRKRIGRCRHICHLLLSVPVLRVDHSRACSTLHSHQTLGWSICHVGRSPGSGKPEQLLSAPCFPLSVEEENKHGTGENRGEAENGDTCGKSVGFACLLLLPPVSSVQVEVPLVGIKFGTVTWKS